MTDGSLRGRADRLAVVALGLLLGLSVATRLIPLADTTPAPDPVGEAVDLGEGVRLPRDAAGPRAVLVGACWTPIPVEFVEPLPHGTDTSPTNPTNADNRVFHAYRGWMLGGRFSLAKLAVLHLAWRGASILQLNGTGAQDTLAIRLTIPAGCGAEPEQAMTALRREVKAGW